ncbi:helix-turn-helix domain-containing protein [Natronomonas marina]|jgi:predicted DNA binding protein|uniref:helix-turn-helix domain-containing protein n=1 Tax=Natronomonas marina TaxID=2961939 RepID=UPI0020CA25CE|nr:helix-turn-helix domain-containing protein [Natronomonas marina]
MRYVRIRLDQPAWMRHPMQEFLATSEAMQREEMLAWNLSRDDVQFLLFYVEGDVDAYRERVAEVEQVRWCELSVVDEASFYAYACEEYTESQTAFFEPFAELRLVVVPPVVFDGNGDLLMTVVGRPTGLTTLVEDLRAVADVGVEVRRVGSYDRRHQRALGAVTDRQREALATATELGYYGSPREASLADVAAALGVAAGTASELLREAEANVMARLVGDDDGA